MSSRGSVERVILQAVIRGGRRDPIPAKNQLAPAGFPLHKCHNLCRWTGMCETSYRQSIMNGIDDESLVVSGWCERYGEGKHGKRLAVLLPELVPTWFAFHSSHYLQFSSGENVEESGLSREEIRKRNFVHMSDLRIHITADGLPQGVAHAFAVGTGPDGLTHELRALAKHR